MNARYSNYEIGMGSICGEDDGATVADLAAIPKALALMDASLAEAKQIRDSNSGLWSRLKATVTDAQLGPMKTEVDSFEKAAAVAHSKASELLTTSVSHQKVVDFLLFVEQISDISVLKDNANRNSLVTLVSDVSKGTLKNLADKTESLTKKIASGFWDALPWYGKVGVAVGVPVVLWGAWKLK